MNNKEIMTKCDDLLVSTRKAKTKVELINIAEKAKLFYEENRTEIPDNGNWMVELKKIEKHLNESKAHSINRSPTLKSKHSELIDFISELKGQFAFQIKLKNEPRI